MRSFGLRFVVQADFLLAASREELLKENEWNLWLRNSLVGAFASAIEIFKQDSVVKFLWTKYLPLAREVEDPFFAHMAGRLYEQLSGMKCLMSAHDTWALPGSLIIPGAEQKCRFGEVCRKRWLE